ncbi:MAG: aldehyde dehydrogenase family protein [Microcystaceae cyanobacterium]
MVLTQTSIPELINKQRQFFATGQTQPLDYRIKQLKALKVAIQDREQEIINSLQADLGKPSLETYLLEIKTTLKEITHTLKHLKSWVKPKKVWEGLLQFPGVAKIYPEPLGVVLIISPWNYPFSLTIQPLIGAIAAGNCATLKPSEIAPETAKTINNLVSDVFDPQCVTVVEGDMEVAQALLQETFDHIFFTGGTEIGRKVMQAAAIHLTPVTLELGGKTPCIVDDDVNLMETAKRIVWGKFLNSGQSCVAPDYLLVKRSIKDNLIKAFQESITQFYGENPSKSPDYGRIVSDHHFQRLTNLLQAGKIITGGNYSEETRYIGPTLMIDVPLDAPVMQEEIFGPILPILDYEQLDEAIAFVNERPKPLALYFFSNDTKKQHNLVTGTSSGGVCFNDTILHLGVINLPFGGVGNSGIGAYHGKASFDTFSHQKSVLRRYFQLEFSLRYPPYGNKINLFKKL